MIIDLIYMINFGLKKLNKFYYNFIIKNIKILLYLYINDS